MAAGAEHECDNWEIRVTTPAPELLEPGPGDTARLSPRGAGGGAGGGGDRGPHAAEWPRRGAEEELRPR